MLKTSDLRNLGEDELMEKAGKLKNDLMQARFQAKMGKLERQSTRREIRQDIARILTVVNEKKAEAKS